MAVIGRVEKLTGLVFDAVGVSRGLINKYVLALDEDEAIMACLCFI